MFDRVTVFRVLLKGTNMPRDDWARANARDAARRGQRMEIIPPAELEQRRLTCKCGNTAMLKKLREFAGGSQQVEVRCAKCGRFVKWQTR
jgi:hypothetical protein